MKRFIPIFIFLIVILYFFRPFILHHLLPIPADTIIGLYHPFRDLYAEDYPNGIPFKNFLITDPVRQQYPWRNLVITLEKQSMMPLWNPYNFSGVPLLGNFQSAVFYPLNILFFVFPFSFAWSLLIVLGPLLAGIFLYWYLRNLKLDIWASAFGGFTFAFSGFFIAWMEWGTITNTALWLPLLLLCTDKLTVRQNEKISSLPADHRLRASDSRSRQGFQIPLFNKRITISKRLLWSILYLFSLISAFFAGHLQTFFYLYLIAIIYFFIRWVQFGRIKNVLFTYIILNALFFICSSIQWIPTLQFISLSARGNDQANWHQNGWFIPWQHMIQFVSPDFFGNPSTGNYWGVWNYGEFIGYIGILPLIMALFALFFRYDKKTLFYTILLLVSLLFSYPTSLAALPFILHLPFLSTSQPTRLLFITDFSLAILAALGFDQFIKEKKKLLYILLAIAIIYIGIFVFLSLPMHLSQIAQYDFQIAKRNTIFSLTIFLLLAITLLARIVVKRPLFRFTMPVLYALLFLITIFDSIRFAEKFIPFTKETYLYPSTATTSFLQSHLGNYRFMTTDSRILPPNFSLMYRLQSVDGYDPLYLENYGELIAASERNRPDINPPFGFNRIITPHRYTSSLINLLGVKYILTLDQIDDQNYKKVFQEGKTKLYENMKVSPRIFFVQHIETVKTKQDAITNMFRTSFSPNKNAVTITNDPSLTNFVGDSAKNVGGSRITSISYAENTVQFTTDNTQDGFLVLTDTYYPTWHAKIDEKETKIYLTDYAFRGIFIPRGKHHIVFYDQVL